MYENGKLFKLVRKSDGGVLFDSFNTQPMLSEYYHELNNILYSDYLWGMGERRVDSFLLPSGEYTTWNFDNGDVEYNMPGNQQYGSHPVWM